MIDQISPRVQRVAALALLALVVALLVAIMVSPLAGAVRSEIEQRRLLLKEMARYQGLVKAGPELRTVLDKIDAHPMWQRVYHESSAGVAESSLQKDLRGLAEAQGISVDTLQPLDPGTEKAFTRISLRIGFNTTIDHLSQLLAAMQAAPHFMTFENLYVTSPMSQSSGGNATLVVRGDVLAYLLPEQAP